LILGMVQLVPVEKNIRVANMIAQRNTVAKDGVPPIRYDALDTHAPIRQKFHQIAVARPPAAAAFADIHHQVFELRWFRQP
jgi:hypothetical protein